MEWKKLQFRNLVKETGISMLFVVDAFSFIKAVAVVVTKSPIVMHLWLSLSFNQQLQL